MANALRPEPHDAHDEPRWTKVARVADLPGDGPHHVAAGEIDLVALRDRSGALRVYEGRCPHQGALLGEGEIDASGALVCRNHRWRFDPTTGKRLGPTPHCLRACSAREAGGDLLVDAEALARSSTARTSRTSTALRSLDSLPGPRTLPLVGNALDIDVERLHLVFEDWHRTYGRMFVARLPGRTLLCVADAELAEIMLRARPETYRRSSVVEPVFRELGVDGVFSAEGKAWRAQRKLSMEPLSHRHLRGFYPTLRTVADRLRARWVAAAESGRVLDVTDELKRFTVDVTVQLVFGHDLDTLRADGDVIQRHLEHVFPAFNRRLNTAIPYWRWFKLPVDREVDHAVAEVRRWLDGLVADARARMEREPERAAKPANFLEAMLAARDEDGEPFSDDVVLGNALTMLLAGEDTTAYTLAWAMHELDLAPEATAALRAEIDKVLDRRSLVPDDIDVANKLAYANAVASETMRLRPVAPVFFLEPNQDVSLGGVHVPKGTQIVLLARAQATTPEAFVDPLVFRPDRWTQPARAGCPHDPGASIPFGSGPRICPGRTLALLEMRVVLATVYRSFDVVRVGHVDDVVERSSFTMMPVGLRFRLRRRR